MRSLGSDVNLFSLFPSFLLVNWRGFRGEVGWGRLYQWVEWEKAHNKLRCFGVPASSFKADKNKQGNIWPTCLESAVSGMWRAECEKMRSCQVV